MPWLPMYAVEQDLADLLSLLNLNDEIAFIVSSGSGAWQATTSISELIPGRYCLWHVPSGSLPLVRRDGSEPGTIDDPFLGWEEERAGADPSTPFFGAGAPGIIWLNVRPTGARAPAPETVVGLSSFEWIGDHYKVLGFPARPETKAFWNALGRWIRKRAVKIPRGGPVSTTPPEIWALPSAMQLFAGGAVGSSA